MSAYTTIRISKSKAIEMVYAYMLKHGCDEQFLEQWCDHILEQRLYNCRVVPDGEPNDEAEAGL